MRVLRVLNVGGYFLSTVLCGGLLLTTAGCEDSKKGDGTVVPATDPAKIAAEKDAREKFMKEGGNKAAAPKK